MRLALLLAALALSCGRKPDRYPPDVIENFMTSCTAQSERRVCRCAIDALQERFTLEEFRGFEARLAAREVPKEMVDAIAGCRS